MRAMVTARDSEQTSSPGASRHAPAPTRPPTGAARLQHALGNRVVQRLVRAVDTDPSPAAIHQAAAAGLHSPAAPLPHRDRIQAAFGRHRLADVRAHLGPDAAASAAAMHADAFTSADHIVFAAAPDLRTAAHEAAHVVHQRAGARPADGVGREGDAWERHADAVADSVVAGRSAEPLLDATPRGAAPAAPVVQRSVGKWLKRAGGALLGLAGGAIALAAAPLIGLGYGAYKGYKAAGGGALGVLGGLGGAIGGAAIGALSPLIGAVYGGVKAVEYAGPNASTGEKIGRGALGALGGLVAPLAGGVLAGVSLADRVGEPVASDARVTAVRTNLAAQYGIVLDDPSDGASGWVEAELTGLEQALDVYGVLLRDEPTARSLALGGAEGLRPHNLRGKHVRRVPHNTGAWDPTTAYASPDQVTVCGDSLLKRAAGPVFDAQKQKGILVHELGHSLLKHELLPYQTYIDEHLARLGRRNFWDTATLGDRATSRATRSGADVEYPITAYGGATPDEDMCETLRYYYESPETRALLQTRAPARYAAIRRIIAENMVPADIANVPDTQTYSDEHGARRDAELDPNALVDVSGRIVALRAQQAAADQAVRDLRVQETALRAGRQARDLSKDDRDALDALRIKINDASFKHQDRTRLARLETRAAHIMRILAGRAPVTAAVASEPVNHPGLSDYHPDGKYSLDRLARALPA